MPSYPRCQIVVSEEAGIYHCVARCVRRTFLCGADVTSGRSFEHRKRWVEERLERLAGAMAVEVCGFAVMSNHLHVIVRIRPDRAADWSADEVARRWLSIRLSATDVDGPVLAARAAEIAADDERIAVLRRRLSCLSWFMRNLCEPIARQANREDGCTGRFWEGRFKSQALLDDAAVLACSIYVDLNPIRAGIATTPETSPHTSAYRRIQSLPSTVSRSKQHSPSAPADRWLCPIALAGPADPSSTSPRPTSFLDMSLADYLRLLDWTGRQIRLDKPGAIPAHFAPILDRLHIEPSRWPTTIRDFGRTFHRAAGRAQSLLAKAASSSLRWLAGLSASRLAFT